MSDANMSVAWKLKRIRSGKLHTAGLACTRERAHRECWMNFDHHPPWLFADEIPLDVRQVGFELWLAYIKGNYAIHEPDEVLIPAWIILIASIAVLIGSLSVSELGFFYIIIGAFISAGFLFNYYKGERVNRRDAAIIEMLQSELNQKGYSYYWHPSVKGKMYSFGTLEKKG